MKSSFKFCITLILIIFMSNLYASKSLECDLGCMKKKCLVTCLKNGDEKKIGRHYCKSMCERAL